MAIEFRCEKCGKLLSAESPGVGKVRCPQCGIASAVPAALASLPQPQVPPNASVPAAPKSAQAAGRQGPPPLPNVLEEEEQQEQEESPVLHAMSQAMPWVFSLFLHLGVILIMSFFVLFAVEHYVPPEVVVPSDEGFSETPGGFTNPGDALSELVAEQRKIQTERTEATDRDSQIQGPTGLTEEQSFVIGMAASSGGGLAQYGMNEGGGSGYGPRGKFMGQGTNAHHIVFVIDRSGSMPAGGVFDLVKVKMADSICDLRDPQDFHIVMFNDGKPLEFTYHRLVPATWEYKEQACKFLTTVIAESQSGKTNPIQALNRAFDVLDKADQKKKGKMIFLLTDGEFHFSETRDAVSDNEKVLQAIRARNKDKSVFIYTYLYDASPDPASEAVKVLKQIAAENGGKFKHVTGDE